MGTRQMLYRVEGDTKPDIVIEYQKDDGSAFDLTDYTIELRAVRPTDRCHFTKEAIIDDAVGGLFHFEFVAGDQLLERGDWELEFEFTKAPDNFTIPKQHPLLLHVRADIQ